MSAAKPDLVLLPGFMCDDQLWHCARAELSAAADLHFGDLSRDTTIAAMADRVLAGAPEKFALVGYSMGGYVAREIIRRAPGRVHGLALVNTSARGVSERDTARKERTLALMRKRPFTGLAWASLQHAVHPDRESDRDLLDHIQGMARRLGKEVFLRQFAMARQDDRPQLAGIRCSTLVIYSDADRMRSLEESEEMAAGIPGARLEIIADCGHMTPLEKPAELARLLIEWL